MQSLTPASADDLPPLDALIADDPFPFQSGTYGEGGTPAEQPRNGDQPGEIPSVIGNAAGGTASPLPREGRESMQRPCEGSDDGRRPQKAAQDSAVGGPAAAVSQRVVLPDRRDHGSRGPQLPQPGGPRCLSLA